MNDVAPTSPSAAGSTGAARGKPAGKLGVKTDGVHNNTNPNALDTTTSELTSRIKLKVGLIT
jgi:hypothetical protein